MFRDLNWLVFGSTARGRFVVQAIKVFLRFIVKLYIFSASIVYLSSVPFAFCLDRAAS